MTGLLKFKNGKSRIRDLKALILLLIVIVCSCVNKEREKTSQELNLRTGKIVFNDSNNILWRHRVDNIKDLDTYLGKFKGVEIDVFFNVDEKRFIIKHDVSTNSEISLDDFFTHIEEPNKFCYWIDIKNLKATNAQAMADHINVLLKKFNLHENVIFESYMVESLKILHNNNIYTSYWIPHFSYNGELTDETKKYIDIIEKNLKDCPHNAISAHYSMLPFITDYFPDCTTHLWTNGLSSEKDKDKINFMKTHKNVKVILVDYEEPF